VEIRGNNNTILLGEGVHFSGKIFVKGENQTLVIGAGSSLRNSYVLVQENCNVSIGKDCLISRGVEIRTSDAHSLIDAQTGQRLNLPGSVSIGDHVWIGTRALISKGSTISANSVVGAMSFVSESFDEPGVVIAGVPAKIVRRGVDWRTERRSRFSLE
jgi:acetyltransferase-like isoleucine patch superfamily enzyme